MLNFVIAAIVMFLFVVAVLGFLAWAIHEHLAARRYRYLIRLHHQMLANGAYNKVATGPRWKISYREKGKVKSVEIEAASEPEALQQFVKTNNVGYGNIVSSEKL